MSTFGMGSGMTDANAMERIMQLKRIQRRTGTLAVLSCFLDRWLAILTLSMLGCRHDTPFSHGQ